MMEIIGLSGYARSGKDEAASVLVNEFGFQRVAFADKLREMLYALNPPTWRFHKGSKEYSTIREVIDEYGWDGYKATHWKDHIRELLQRLGTEAGRETLWDSIWVDAAFAGIADDAKVVVTDCRFENEAQGIIDRGGRMWRLTRRGVGPINDHPSETGLDNWKFDKRLANYGTVEEWHDQIRSTYRGYI